MISVVIPLYNKEASIANTLNCVLAQTYQDFEIVVVDDGSTDNSAAIVDTFKDTRIRLIRQSNGGVSAARNTGIREAKGEYVAFLDADDVWMEGHLDNLVQLINKYPKNKAFATNYYNELKGVRKNIVLNKIPFSTEYGVLNNYFEICCCSHPPVWSSAVCVERNLIMEVGGFPVGVKSGEDLLTWACIAVRTDWAYSMKPTAIFMLGNESVSTSRRKHDDYDRVGGALVALLNDNPDVGGLADYVSLWFKMRALCCLQTIDRKGVYKEACKALRYNTKNFKLYAYCLIALLPKTIIKKLIENLTR